MLLVLVVLYTTIFKPYKASAFHFYICYVSSISILLFVYVLIIYLDFIKYVVYGNGPSYIFQEHEHMPLFLPLPTPFTKFTIYACRCFLYLSQRSLSFVVDYRLPLLHWLCYHMVTS